MNSTTYSFKANVQNEPSRVSFLDVPLASNEGEAMRQSDDTLNQGRDNRIANLDLDNIESIDTEPEVITSPNSISCAPEKDAEIKVMLRRNPEEIVPEERYLSLIASSPSTSITMLDTPEPHEQNPINNALNNAQQVISNTRRSLTDLIIPSGEISETLSIPRKTNVRRENDYVKIKPKIEKLRFSTPTYPAAGVVRETPL